MKAGTSTSSQRAPYPISLDFFIGLLSILTKLVDSGILKSALAEHYFYTAVSQTYCVSWEPGNLAPRVLSYSWNLGARDWTIEFCIDKPNRIRFRNTAINVRCTVYHALLFLIEDDSSLSYSHGD